MSIADTLLEGSNGDYSSEQEEIRKGVIEKLQAFEDVNANLEGRRHRTVRPMSEYAGNVEWDNVGGFFTRKYPEDIYVGDEYINGFDYDESCRAEALNIVAHEGLHAAQYDFACDKLENDQQYREFCRSEEGLLAPMEDYEAMRNCFETEGDYYHGNYFNMPDEITARDGAAFLSKKYCNDHRELKVSEEALDHVADDTETAAIGVTLIDSNRITVWDDVMSGKSTGKENTVEPVTGDTMNDVANEAATPENRSSNEEGIGQQQDTMRNIADQAALPENAPSNGQEEGQAQERGNTMSM